MPESSLAKDFAIVPGSRISHYRVESKIGAGGMGEVFLATDLTLERQVALKILPPQLLSDAERVRRFVQEAKSASALNHPNIVTIYEIGQAQVLAGDDRTADFTNGQPAPESAAHTVHYMAMEFIEGKTLRSMIYGGAPLSDVLKMMAQSADGLAKAHDAGIVHRDLKPDNIMVTTDGYAKIVDFGLAKLTEQKQQQKGGEQLTQSGMVMGTVGYMSPEQVDGGVITPASDIFSFGCIIFECATKKRPFESDLAIDTLHKIMFSEPLPLIAVTASAPTALQPVIDRCLRKKAGERYGSMREVAAALREVAPVSGPVAQPQAPAVPSPYAIPAPASTGSRRIPRPAAAPELPQVSRSSRRRAARIFSNFYKLAFLAIVGSAIYIWATMPPVAKLADERPPSVAGWVDFGDVAPAARRAVVAATDPRYYKRQDFHFKDIDKFFSAGSQGERSLYLPSPLTRAVAKALYPLPAWNPIAPARHLVVAEVMERTLSRRRIVELYLNAVRFGDVSGVAEAAKRYYKKDPSRLTDKEAAMIAASAFADTFDPANPGSDLIALQANILGSLPPEPKKPSRKKSKASEETTQPKSEGDDASAFETPPETTETTTDPAPPKSER